MTLARLAAMRGHLCQHTPTDPAPTGLEMLSVFLMAEEYARIAMGVYQGHAVEDHALELGRSLMAAEIGEAEGIAT